MRHSLLALSITSIFLLASCGGGGDSSNVSEPTPTPTPPVPTPTPLPDPGDEEEDDEEDDDEHSRIDAARLLNQATFGATLDDINDVLQFSGEAWIDEQFQQTSTNHVALINEIDVPYSDGEIWRDHRMYAWWDAVVDGDDQLRQRVAFALSQILVISDRSIFGGEHEAVANYYDLLVEHSFGNFRDLLEAVTLSPLMGLYLSMLGNEKPDEARNIRPDENYARELMQLFSIGLVELNTDGTSKLGADNQPIPTYDQNTIENYAHVFTGWHFEGTTEETWYYWWDNFNVDDPMVSVDAFHAINEKTLLNGVIVPANQTAIEDLALALDSLFFHPNVGPFIGKQLIQKLVTSNPSPDYVARVASAFNDNGFGVRGDMKAVIKAILLDREARTIPALDSEFGKLREPLIKFAHMLRALNTSSGNGLVDIPYPDYFANQAPLSSPSVFNFFSPSYSTPSELNDNQLVAPELQIMTETYVVRATNFFAYTALWSHSIDDPDEKQLVIDYSREIDMLVVPELLIEHINTLFLSGMMTDNLKSIFLDVLEETEGQEPSERVAYLVFLIVASPQYAVQR